MMDDKKPIKTIFSVEAVSIISDTADNKQGEAVVGYEYNLDTSLPELTFALAGFLKAMDEDEDMKQTVSDGQAVGSTFITLLQQYYDMKE
jgi:hypothetical protein